MKIINYKEISPVPFNGDSVRAVAGRVAIGSADGAENFCMRVFTLGLEGFTPKHSHAWEHEIFIHSGKGKVFSHGEWVDVQGGSVVFVPGGEEHQLKNDGEEDFVFVCLIPSGVPEL